MLRYYPRPIIIIACSEYVSEFLSYTVQPLWIPRRSALLRQLVVAKNVESFTFNCEVYLGVTLPLPLNLARRAFPSR